MGDGIGIGGVTGLISCTLSNGEVQDMTPEACLLAGGMYGDLVACLLPDGSVKQLTQEDCLTLGGSFGDDLLGLQVDLEGMLDDLGGPGTDADSEIIITSLINLHKDITVEKATKRKGKRYGFYQSDINKSEE